MSAHHLALGPMAELHHQLDQYLASAGLPLARPGRDGGGLLFGTRQGVQVAALMRADEGASLVACPGYFAAEPLRRLRADELDGADASFGPLGPLERLSQDAVVRWREAGLPWSLSVERAQGVASLCLLLPGLPDRAAAWDDHLRVFESAFAQWAQRLQAEPPALDDSTAWQAGVGGEHWRLRA